MINKCPQCNNTIIPKKLSFLGKLGVGIFGEITIWIVAGLFVLFFSVADFSNAYFYSLLFLVILAIVLMVFYKDYHCISCKKQFSLFDLHRAKIKGILTRS